MSDETTDAIIAALDALPNEMQDAISEPLLLASEDFGSFRDMAIKILEMTKPEGFLEQSLTCDLIHLFWDAYRYRELSTPIFKIAQAQAVEMLFAQDYLAKAGVDAKVLTKLQARSKAKDWRHASNEEKLEIQGELESSGFGMFAVEAEAFRLAHPTLVSLDRIRASTQARSLKLIREIWAIQARSGRGPNVPPPASISVQQISASRPGTHA